MATAGKITIAEVEEIVENGEFDPAEIHIPGIYVQRIVKGSAFEKRIEVGSFIFLCHFLYHLVYLLTLFVRFIQKLTLDSKESADKGGSLSEAAERRQRIIRRAALEFKVCFEWKLFLLAWC